MTLDADKYRVNIPYIKLSLDGLTQDERYEAISSIAVATHVPIIAVAVYVGELYGFTSELVDFITRMQSFYHITDIKGIK